MSQTYSTINRDMAAGRIHSSRAKPLTPPGGPGRGQRAAAVPTPSTTEAPRPGAGLFRRTFALTGTGIPSAARIAPGGASGSVTVEGLPGGTHKVSGTVRGLAVISDPAVRPVLWLIHDLTVPQDLSPADLAALPHGPASTANQPGSVFTLDGKAPTYGPTSNTLAVAISPASFQRGADGTWQASGGIDAGTNQAFHPLVMLGPGALGDLNTPLPSGTVARILTDLFMRPATVHPELNLRTHFAQRLAAVVRDALGSGAAPSFLTPDQFTRAAVTVEGLVRATPVLMPTRETCFLMASAPGEG